MTLPNSNKLPINNLSAVFNNTTNSYKFYWFLSILDLLKKQTQSIISIDDIVFNMITKVWYPINYFRISFGKQDKFSSHIEVIRNEYGLKRKLKDEELTSFFLAARNESIIKKLFSDLIRYVPYRFLTPWFSVELRGRKDYVKDKIIISCSDKYFGHNNIKPLYRFSHNSKSIEIDEDWLNYLTENLRIIEDFTFWNLSNYLRKHNPNVPNIQEKLFAPKSRELFTVRKYWRNYLDNNEDTRCVYSQQVITNTKWAIDHFLPWSFTAHDQLWNLIPTPESVNSIKSDYIPSEKYLSDYCKIQFSAIHFFSKMYNNSKILEDYSIIFNDEIDRILKISIHEFTQKLISNFKPLIQIAINMGFEGKWEYKK